MNIIKERLKRVYGRLLTIGKPNDTIPHVKIITLFAKILKPKVYVELGVYQGDIVNRMIPFVEEKIVAVDISKEAGSFLKKNKKVHFYHGTTTSCAEFLTKENIKIDMLFIDADHKKSSVLEDFKNYFPLVKEDGIIFLHDGYPKNKEQTHDGYCSNCWEAIWELSQETKEYEMMTIPLHPGLTICRKRVKQVAWL